MSRSKPRNVFLVRSASGAPYVYVVARHAKGALSVVRESGFDVKGAEVERAADDRAAYAINAATKS